MRKIEVPVELNTWDRDKFKKGLSYSHQKMHPSRRETSGEPGMAEPEGCRDARGLGLYREEPRPGDEEQVQGL